MRCAISRRRPASRDAFGRRAFRGRRTADWRRSRRPRGASLLGPVPTRLSLSRHDRAVRHLAPAVQADSRRACRPANNVDWSWHRTASRWCDEPVALARRRAAPPPTGATPCASCSGRLPALDGPPSGELLDIPGARLRPRRALAPAPEPRGAGAGVAVAAARPAAARRGAVLPCPRQQLRHRQGRVAARPPRAADSTVWRGACRRSASRCWPSTTGVSASARTAANAHWSSN